MSSGIKTTAVGFAAFAFGILTLVLGSAVGGVLATLSLLLGVLTLIAGIGVLLIGMLMLMFSYISRMQPRG